MNWTEYARSTATPEKWIAEVPALDGKSPPAWVLMNGDQIERSIERMRARQIKRLWSRE